MRLIASATFCALTILLSSCAAQDEESRKTSEAGGTIPWNKPAGWHAPVSWARNCPMLKAAAAADSDIFHSRFSIVE